MSRILTPFNNPFVDSNPTQNLHDRPSCRSGFVDSLPDALSILRHTQEACGITEWPTVIPVPDSACGILTFDWKLNSRVGPFFDTVPGQNVYVCGSSGNKMTVNFSSAYGEGLFTVSDDTYPSVLNTLRSHDAHDLGVDCYTPDDYILVGTQEGNGRVGFGLYQKSINTWLRKNVEAVTSASIGSSFAVGECGVSVTRRSNGQCVLFYDTNKEDVGGTFYGRVACKLSSDDGETWGPEIPLGHVGVGTNNRPGRVIADDDGRLHFWFGNTNTPFFGHIYHQVMRANNTLSSIGTVFEGGGTSQVQSGRCVGDYGTVNDGGTFRIFVPVRHLNQANLKTYVPTDNALGAGLDGNHTDGSCFIGATAAIYPMFSLRFANGLIHGLAMRFTNTSPTWVYHRTRTTGAITWTPNQNNENQFGPKFDAVGFNQEMGGTIVELDGELFGATVMDPGTLSSGNKIFNLIKLSDLPSTEVIGDWLTRCS